MNAAELLTGLQSRGVVATVNADKLKLHGSPEVLTPGVLETVKANKSALLELLKGEPAQSTPSPPSLVPWPANRTAANTPTVAQPAPRNDLSRARVRAMAQEVTPAELLQARKKLTREMRDGLTAAQVNSMLIQIVIMGRDKAEREPVQGGDADSS